jgi:DNA polymerase-3 subunit epsilon
VGINKIKLNFVKDKNIAILDVETTGIRAGANKIIEIYILKVINEKVVSEYYSKFNPKQDIPLFISNLTGIYQWHLKDAPFIDDEILNIKNFVSDSVIIGHNLKFDLSFLNYELTSNNLQKLNNETIDTLNLSRALLRSKVKNHKLVTLSKYFKTINQNEHNAKADVLTTYEVFKNLSVFEQLKDKKNVEGVNNYLNSIDSHLKNKFSIKDIPNTHGVYIFSNNKNVQYIGKSNNLKTRINSHLSHSRSYKSNKIVNSSNNLQIINLNNELASLLVEHRLINKLKPSLNRSGRISRNIYWIKLKYNKHNFEISKLKNSKNTLYQLGPFLSYSKAKDFKKFLDFKFETLNCKRNNSRKSQCDISILLGTDCACVDSFNLDIYLKNVNKKLVLFFKNKEKELKILTKKLNQESALQNYEEAQKLKNFKSIFENYIDFENFTSNILNQDSKVINLLKNSNIDISKDRIYLELNSDNECADFVNLDDKNYSEINFYNELQLILRFIRNKDPYTISR